MKSGKDLTAHTELKFRQVGQASKTEIAQKDLRHELDQREAKYVLEKSKTTAWLADEETKVDVPLLLKNQPELDVEKLQQYDDKDVEVNDSDDFDSSRCASCEHNILLFNALTLFLPPTLSDEDSDSDEDDSDDDDDDEKELQAELERIRAERAAAQAKKLQEEKDIEEKLKRDSALKSNPLLTNEDSSAKVSHID